MFFRSVILFFWLLLNVPAFSQKTDTVKVYSLPEINISGKVTENVIRSTTPSQIISSDKLEQLNALQLSDAVKFFSGVTVKDFGGIGGLKTISIRSLGANHTAIGYDGIALSDCQTGQIDLGRFSLDNVESISLNAGQNDNIFQTARFFASAGVLNVKTLTPLFRPNTTINCKATLKAGSFGLFNPAFLMENKLSGKYSTSVNAEWLQADGDYPYTLHYGSKNDSLVRRKRENSDIKTFHTEVGLFGKPADESQLKLKAYYYQSEKGLPGATIDYYDFTSQRLWEKTFFTQANYEQVINPKISLQANSKFNWAYQRYLNPDYLSSTGQQENNYYQWEYYLSGSIQYHPVNPLSFVLSTDGSLNTMNADLPSFAYPERLSLLTVLAGKYIIEKFTLTGNLLATMTNENAHYNSQPTPTSGQQAKGRQKVTPSVSLSFQPFNSENLHLRLMYKEIFRLPTFNDLYYSRIGNPSLNPEYTWQYNAGISWERKLLAWLPSASLTVDCYYNKIKDKIIAVPTKNIFEWSMQNLGKVDIYGTDINMNVKFIPYKNWELDISGAYTIQKAWDVTSKTDPVYKHVYKHQIAYTPEHSGSGSIGIKNPWINVAYTLIYSGSRYAAGENIPANYLHSYTDQSISLNKRLPWKKTICTANLEVLNILDKQYEVIRWFPMPGRSVRLTISIKI